ncbi:hypothetical protein [Mucilaginibacter pocheonensis]|uniref:Fimbrillin-A associated anchor protein Mfa1 and Mfa2 n=1 Tax=Mucilaginibacter pocheonensis TaxID=398050 RepID=A0ABU1T7M1_9SPHI|nr:hypothetical protein [Mucilaginibacter pocheonensis]MDR6941284.1 hypothetical protein [Mucilaginibacter pocheonensis]
MKNALICFILISIVLLSCKKDNHNKTTEPQTKLYPVTFTISNFTQQNEPINQKSKTKINATVTPDSSTVKRLIYKVYDSSNTLKRTIVVNKGGPGFGTFKDSLATGNYTAVFVGVVNVTSFADDGSKFYYIDNSTGTPRKADPSETFYKKISFAVGSQHLQQNVVLERLNSQIQIIMKDAIPSYIRSIRLNITGQNLSYSYLGDTSSDESSITILTLIPSDKIGTTNYTLKTLPNLLNTNSTVTVEVISYGAENVEATRKTISNITLQRNTLTILTGNVFTGDTNGFTVTYNSVYNPDINVGF